MRIKIRVRARSSKEKIVENPDGSLKVYLKTAPVDGKANRSLMTLLSDHYGVCKADIRIVNGETSSNKLIEVKEEK